ncbi:hypothetical protein [Dyella sp. AD56]|uniref:hypothetical protein n=1 Tax=Dyella sp. AD56 TaxID=1528744 RepID=UPI0011AFB270|nr:hypothetical protein [Dyella sp. AD56]
MHPPPLDVATMRASKDVKDIVIDPSKLSANMLLKDGSSVRIINMGCQHSGSVARSWVMNPASLSDSAAWIQEADKIARIAFTPTEAKSFVAWAAKGQLQKPDDSHLVLDGTGYGDMAYSIEVESASMGMGAWLTISYAYP